MSLVSGKRVALDATCAEAVDAARAALEDVTPAETIGEHLGVEPESERVVIHYFASHLPGYRGWRWAVTVMRASRSKTVTIGESVLLPGPDALLPPAWVPWTDRLRPGDLGVGDLLPTEEDDPRLEPGWNAFEVPTAMDDGSEDTARATADQIDAELDADVDAGVDLGAQLAALEVAIELDLVRPRVLSPIGLDDAVDRWVSGEHGPDASMAQSAPAMCATCGFRIALRGRLGQSFGVCANEISPSDGHIVTLDHGCGAHSEAVVIPTMADRPEPVVDEVGFETVERADATEESPTEEGPTEQGSEPASR
ncbi:MAG TPA: DUF3027 domain-containing protein [Actinomycetes bacterium]|nr:DUF3027 domain-containing protein [Actinomycetes bacterium]